MKLSDYIIGFLEENQVADIFGYPGVGCGHFMDSLSRSASIKNHLTYHEQAAAFAACAYAQATNQIGIAYSTAGPGATNLLTGVANAYCDSIPTLFIVGNKDLASLRGSFDIRQKASQEIDIVRMSQPITKWSYQLTNKDDIRYVLEKAVYTALNGRPGPVLLDIPSDIQRGEIDSDTLIHFSQPNPSFDDAAILEVIRRELQEARQPVLLVGNGIKQAGLEDDLLKFAKRFHLPIVTTLVCFDLFPDEVNKLGFIGLDGNTVSNQIVNKCDLLISFGARLNFKQVCNCRETFVPKGKIIRIDCDQGELNYRLRDEISLCIDLRTLVPKLSELHIGTRNSNWLNQCIAEKENYNHIQSTKENTLSLLLDNIPEFTPIAVDTGTHRRSIIHQIRFKKGQRFYQSSGLASMGYALPAAIGLYYAKRKPVVCFTGDGGLMMNMQELQMISRDRLPISVVVINNQCLGDIMNFQRKIFKENYFATTASTGYSAGDFERIAYAFRLKYKKLTNLSDFKNYMLEEPAIIELRI